MIKSLKYYRQRLPLLLWLMGWLLLFNTHTPYPPLRIAVDIGHSPKRTGATSARGISEYHYNRSLGLKLQQRLQQKGFDSFILTAGNLEMGLKSRASLARIHADLLISIHHDSVQPQYLKTWVYHQQEQQYSDDFQGYSLFVSRLNPAYEASYQYAQYLAQALYQQNLRPTLHHAEAISGENRLLLDRRLGIYQYNNLVVVRESKIPAVLLECGVLVNRQQELSLADEKSQEIFIHAIIKAIQDYRKNQPK